MYLFKISHHRLWEAFYQRSNINAIEHPCIHSTSLHFLYLLLCQ